MSGEFGDCYSSRFFHEHMGHAFEGASAEAKLKTTKEWLKVVKPLSEISKDISYAEAGDSNEATLIVSSLIMLPVLKKAVAELEEYLTKYELVAKKRYGKES